MDVRWAGVSNPTKSKTESKPPSAKSKKSNASNALLKEILMMSNELKIEREKSLDHENSVTDLQGGEVIFFFQICSSMQTNFNCCDNKMIGEIIVKFIGLLVLCIVFFYNFILSGSSMKIK